MARTRAAIGDKIMKLWRRLLPLPGGRRLFSFILGKFIPYTGTIKPQVKEIRPGYARVELCDRRRVRNHLNSIHAIALMNLGELTTGLALLTGLQPGVQGIITGLSIEYYKKARGHLYAKSETALPDIKDDMEHEVAAEIKDRDGDVVARCTARWRLGLIA